MKMNNSENANKPGQKRSVVSVSFNLEEQLDMKNPNMCSSHEKRYHKNLECINGADSEETVSDIDEDDTGIRMEVDGQVYECKTMKLHKVHPFCYSKYSN